MAAVKAGYYVSFASLGTLTRGILTRLIDALEFSTE